MHRTQERHPSCSRRTAGDEKGPSSTRKHHGQRYAMTERCDGFVANLFEDEMGDWIAYFVAQPKVPAFAKTAEAALHELAHAWQTVKETCRDEGEPIPVARKE